MNRRRQLLVLPVVVLATGLAKAASEPIYDEKADARQQIATAVADASRTNPPSKNIVLVFGANWCADCRALDARMRKPELASIIGKNFVVVKVDVGRMDKNLDLAEKYGVPVKRGIPALAVLNSRGRLLYAQDQGQFSSARSMDSSAFKAFFEQWKPES